MFFLQPNPKYLFSKNQGIKAISSQVGIKHFGITFSTSHLLVLLQIQIYYYIYNISIVIFCVKTGTNNVNIGVNDKKKIYFLFFLF